MKVKYIGTEHIDTMFEKDKEYDVISVEKGWFRIKGELEEDDLFPPEVFEIIEDDSNKSYESG